MDYDPIKFHRAIDNYFADQRSAGRINSKNTIAAYRSALEPLAELVDNDDPRHVTREQIKEVLAQWPHPNSQRQKRSALVSFFDWLMEEGYRPDNPARQTRRPKKRPTSVYELTLVEVCGMLDACRTSHELRVVHVALCAGLRNAELRGLRGKHFRREGVIWVSADIAKGGRERYVPVTADLLPIWTNINQSVGPEHFVLPYHRSGNVAGKDWLIETPTRPTSATRIGRIVAEVALRAGIDAHIHPHLLRHAFAVHVARTAGMRNAQFMLGHASIGTTETYTGKPTIDEMSRAMRDVSYREGCA